MAQEQITNTGVIPSMVSTDDGYSTQQGLEELLGLGVKVVSIRGAKGKKIIEAQKWKSQPYRQARAERSAMESLLFTLKESFEFGEMMRRTHENVLAEMLEKILAYNCLQYLSDHPGAEEAFRTTRDGTSSGLTRSIIVSPEIIKQSRTVPSPGPQRTTAPSKIQLQPPKGAAAKKQASAPLTSSRPKARYPFFGEPQASHE